MLVSSARKQNLIERQTVLLNSTMSGYDITQRVNVDLEYGALARWL